MKILTLILTLLPICAWGAGKRSRASVIVWDQVACERAVVNSKPDLKARAYYAAGLQIDMQRMRETVEVIAGHRRLEDGVRIDERKNVFAKALVRGIIVDKLRALGLDARVEVISQGANVVAEIRGTNKPREVVEIVTHYDTTGYSGADDNGSGVAFNLEFARVAKQYQFDRTLRFVFTDLEEDLRQGASRHIELQQGKPDKIVAAFVVDTIAWGSKERDRQIVVLEVGTPEMFKSAEGYEPQKNLALQIAYLAQRFPVASLLGTVDFSFETERSEPKTADHGIYWKGGIPTVMIGEATKSGLLNPNYHMRGDTVDNMNWDYYEAVSKQIAGIIMGVAGLAVADVKMDPNLEETLIKVEQTQVSVLTDLPEPLDWDLYRPPRASYSSSSGYKGELSTALAAAKAAIENMNPADFILGVMPDPPERHRRLFIINLATRQRWEEIGIDAKIGDRFIDYARDAGVQIIVLNEVKGAFTVDMSKMFLSHYPDNLDKLKDQGFVWKLLPKPAPRPQLVLSDTLSTFLDETGLSKFNEKGALILGIVAKEENGFLPFFIADPRIGRFLSRRNLLSIEDLEVLHLYLRERLAARTLVIDNVDLDGEPDALSRLAHNFATRFVVNLDDLRKDYPFTELEPEDVRSGN